MNTALAVLVIIFAGVWLCAYLGLWHSIDNIKDSLDYIKRMRNNGSEISQSKYELYELISKLHKDLLTEIACLATKNNEDIKRMGGNYIVGDILKFDGTRWCIFGKDLLADGRTRWKLFGENEEEYRIYSDSIPEDIEFIKHSELSF